MAPRDRLRTSEDTNVDHLYLMLSLVKPPSKKARRKMRGLVAFLAKQHQRQKAVASETQAEASLALECDKPRTRLPAIAGRRRKQTARRQTCCVGEPKPKVRFCWRGRHAWVGSARAKHEAAEGRGARKKERKKTDNPREGWEGRQNFF